MSIAPYSSPASHVSRRMLFALSVASALGGACAGVVLTLQLTRKPAEPHDVVRDSTNGYYDPQPEQMLYPEGTTLEMLYRDNGLLGAIRKPDEIWIYPVGGDEKIHAGNHRFSSQASKPSQETSARLIYALCSLSSYEPPGKACTFDPGVLLRLKKDGQIYDMMFCFSCRQIVASADGGADMSTRGCETFLKCFCDTLPDFRKLSEIRKKRVARE